MNSLKTYKLANRKKFQVEYGYKAGKWNFRIGTYILMTKVPGGKENADRIAEILRKSWFRHGEIDGAARTAINNIVNAKFKSLKNYRGAWDHNWSWNDSPTKRIDDVVVEAEPVLG